MLARLKIAYEPFWAVGSEWHQATPQQEAVVIKMCFSQIFGENAAQNLVILYGGSANSVNAAALFSQRWVYGLLIGADSLNADQFLAIVRAGISEQQIKGKLA
jgi:triosephosphate isomerase